MFSSLVKVGIARLDATIVAKIYSCFECNKRDIKAYRMCTRYLYLRTSYIKMFLRSYLQNSSFY